MCELGERGFSSGASFYRCPASLKCALCARTHITYKVFDSFLDHICDFFSFLLGPTHCLGAGLYCNQQILFFQLTVHPSILLVSSVSCSWTCRPSTPSRPFWHFWRTRSASAAWYPQPPSQISSSTTRRALTMSSLPRGRSPPVTTGRAPMMSLPVALSRGEIKSSRSSRMTRLTYYPYFFRDNWAILF